MGGKESTGVRGSSAAPRGGEMTYEEAIVSLHPEKLSPCYLIYGEERFFVNQLLNWFLEKTISEESRSLNYSRLDGNQVDPEEMILLAGSYPMIGVRRLIILDNADKIKDPQGHLLSYLSAPSPKTIVVFVAQKPDMRTKLFSALKGQATAIFCRPLYDNEVARFIRQEAGRQGLRFSEEAIGSLKESLGANPYLIQKELEKAAMAGAYGPMAPSGPLRDHTVFELTDAVGERDSAKGLRILSFLLSEGEPPLIILSMLIRHFRIMASTKEGLRSEPESVVRKRIGMPPSRVGAFLKQVHGWTSQEIRLAFDLFREADSQLKGGAVAGLIVMEGLVLALLGRPSLFTPFRGHPTHS